MSTLLCAQRRRVLSHRRRHSRREYGRSRDDWLTTWVGVAIVPGNPCVEWPETFARGCLSGAGSAQGDVG